MCIQSPRYQNFDYFGHNKYGFPLLINVIIFLQLSRNPEIPYLRSKTLITGEIYYLQKYAVLKNQFSWVLSESYGGPQVHSECQTTLLILNPTLNSWISLQIPNPHSELKNITPNSKKLTANSKTSLWIQKHHSEFLKLTPNSKISLWIKKISVRILEPHSEFQNFTPS